MKTVESKDGTLIAVEESGKGPPVILVCGASVDRMSNAPLAALLADKYTVLNYDRRGRGESGDTPPYAVEKEIEDLEAVVKLAGSPVFLYGVSSGAALAVDAAMVLRDKVKKLALWEPPYFADDTYPRPPADSAQTYTNLVAEGRRGEAVEFFMAKVIGLPAEFVASARKSPWWAGQEAIAHTLAYDAYIMGDFSLPKNKIAELEMPTLVMVGEASKPFMHLMADAMEKILMHGQKRVLKGQTHNASPDVLASALKEFFGE